VHGLDSPLMRHLEHRCTGPSFDAHSSRKQSLIGILQSVESVAAVALVSTAGHLTGTVVSELLLVAIASTSTRG